MLFLDGTGTQAPLAVPLVAMGTERVAKEIEALLPGISQRGLVLIDLEPEPRHYVGIRDDVTTERFATTRQPPPQSPRRRSPGRWRGAPNRTGRASADHRTNGPAFGGPGAGIAIFLNPGSLSRRGHQDMAEAGSICWRPCLTRLSRAARSPAGVLSRTYGNDASNISHIRWFMTARGRRS